MRGGNRGQGQRNGATMAGMLLAVSTAASIVPLTPAMAQAGETRSFDIPAQPLQDAIVLFNRQSGVQVTAEGGLTAGRNAAAVKGEQSVARALATLLSGTGLTYRWVDSRTVTLERASQGADGAIQLGTLRVEGTGDASAGSGASRGSEFGDGSDTGDVAFRSPRSMSYITRDEIERNRGSQPSDIFRGVPGVLSGDSRNSGGLDLNIRGMQGMSRVPVVIDGAQHSTTVYRGYAGAASRTYVDPDLIGGIEIFKGPTSGADAVGTIGGVVRMRTLNASDILLPGKSFGIRARGGFSTNSREAPPVYTRGGLRTTMTGSFLTGCNYANCGTIVPAPDIDDINDLGNARGFGRPSWIEPTGGYGSIAVAKVWDNIELVGAVAYRKAGNYFAGSHGNAPELTISQRTQVLGGGRERYYTDIGFIAQLNRFRLEEEILNTSSENLSYLVKATIRPFEGHALELGYNQYNSWFGESMPSSIIRGTGALQSPMSRINLDTMTARYSWDPSSEWIKLQANYSRTELDNRIVTAYDFSDNPLYAYTQPYEARTNRDSFDLSNRAAFDFGLGPVVVNVGGSYAYESTFQIPGAAPTYSDGIPRNGWRREYSGFGDFSWDPVEHFSLTGAIRYTRFESYDRKGGRYQLPTGGQSAIVHAAYDEAGWAPTVSATAKPAKWLQFYVRYAQAIRMPSLFEVTAGWSQSPNPFVPIRPEHAYTWELGTNLSIDRLAFNTDELRLKFAWFDSDVKDYLTRSSGATWDDTQQMIRNIDRARFQGLEASFEYRQGPVKLELFATHYLKSDLCEFARRGYVGSPQPPVLVCNTELYQAYVRNHIPPEWAGGGSLSLSLFGDRLNLFGRVVHTGSRPSEALFSPPDGGVIQIIDWHHYTLVDASVQFKLNDHVRFDITGDNLTDKYYMDALTLGLMASPGRTIRAGVTFNF